MLDRLTAAQRNLFHDLARFAVAETLLSPFVPVPAGIDEYAIYLRGKHTYRIRSYDDLTALCTAGLLDWELTRMGSYKQFSISKLGLTMLQSGELHQPGSLSNNIELTTRQLRSAVRSLLRGQALDNTLAAIGRVQRELNDEFCNGWRIQQGLKDVGELIIGRFELGTLSEVGEAAICYGRWCETIAQHVERQAERDFA